MSKKVDLSCIAVPIKRFKKCPPKYYLVNNYYSIVIMFYLSVVYLQVPATVTAKVTN